MKILNTNKTVIQKFYNKYINISQISSISEVKELYLPFSGTYKGNYAVVSMQNADRFYINETEHTKLIEYINNV